MSGTTMAAMNPGATEMVTAGGGGFMIERQFVREASIVLPQGVATFERGSFSIAPRIAMSLTPTRREADDAVWDVVARMEADGMTVETPLTGPEPWAVYRVVVEWAAVVRMADVPEEAVGPILMRDVMRMLFPSIRAMAARLTIESGVPPLLLTPLTESVVWREEGLGRIVQVG